MTEQIKQALVEALQKQGAPYPEGVIISEPPHHIAADFAVNVALQVAKAEGKNPREVAEQLKASLLEQGGFSGVEIAGPGFLNLTLDDSLYAQVFKEETSTIKKDESKKIVVEYISANPTGPLHIGNARGGPMGETIARVLEARGNNVHRDFYVNDVGGQAAKFAKSVLYYYQKHFGMETEFPEGGYPENVVGTVVEEIANEEGDSLLKLPIDQQEEAIRETAIRRQVARIQNSVERMGIHFDSWSTQSDVVASGRSASTLGILESRGSTVEKDGAIWLSSEHHEDDRETVLVKSDKTTTYFLDDIAFYRMKLDEWEKDYAVCVLGPGHLDHITRMKAGLIGIGIDPERYKGTIYQNVQLKQDGVKVKMAKREGNFVTADQVLDEVPLEVFNWFMLSKAPETHLDFDLQLAKDTSEKNPIYYVQYAHARICSILARAGEMGEAAQSFNAEERSLLRHLSKFNEVVAEVAESYRTHLIPTYLFDLATRFHHFYARHRVLTDDPAESAKRVALSKKTAETLKNGLALMNIEAQDHM